MPGVWLAAALAAIVASATVAAILVDQMPAFDGRAIFFAEVALAIALGLLVFWYSQRSDRAMKSSLGEVRSMLQRNDKAKQIRRMSASRALHTAISAMLDTCDTLVKMIDHSDKTPEPEWGQFKANLAALHGNVKTSADRLGRELEHAGYLDDRAYDDIAAAVGLLEETIRADDEAKTVDTTPYLAITDALGPVLSRLERRLGLGKDAPLAVPGPADPADTSDRLKIRLDRPVYYPNSVIRASVEADEPFPSGKVTVAILDENLDELAKKTKKAPKANRRTAGALTMDIRPKGLAVDRRYIARATCGGLVSEEMFAVDQSAPVVQTDKSVYMIDGDMTVTVLDPSANTDSAAEEHVGNAEKSRLVIKSPHGTIDGYRLEETGRSTGIFQGIVRCMGVRDDGSVRETMLDDGVYVDKTQGTGTEDGVIACAPGNLIQIRYTNEFGTGEVDVFVARFAPIVELDRDEYPCTASVDIRVILPDFAASGGQPATIGDNSRDCWVTISTSEKSLDGYRLAETGPDSSMFAGTVSLTGLAGMGGRKSAAHGAAHGDTRGAGPHDGMLACKPHDAVRVSVKSAFAREVRAEAPVRWHIGDVRMSKAVYLPGEEASVRVAHGHVVHVEAGGAEFLAGFPLGLRVVASSRVDGRCQTNQAAIEKGGALEFLLAQVAVAAGKRQPGCRPHRRHPNHLHRHVQLPGHGANHGQLLPVLLAEERPLRRDDVEQLGDHRGHAVEVARTTGAAQGVGQRRNRNPRRQLLAFWVHLLHARREHHVHPFGFQPRQVCPRSARIAAEVLVGAELGRVDEDGNHATCRTRAAAAHQRQVSFVQVAHRRHQADVRLAAQPFAQSGDVAHHVQELTRPGSPLASALLGEGQAKECSGPGKVPARTASA